MYPTKNQRMQNFRSSRSSRQIPDHGVIALRLATKLTGAAGSLESSCERSALEWILDLQGNEEKSRRTRLSVLSLTRIDFADHKEKVIDLVMRGQRGVSVGNCGIGEAMKSAKR